MYLKNNKLQQETLTLPHPFNVSVYQKKHFCYWAWEIKA